MEIQKTNWLINKGISPAVADHHALFLQVGEMPGGTK